MSDKPKDLIERIDECLEDYVCKYHQEPSMNNPHGCTDCLNRGYIFDSLESGLLNEAHQEITKLRNQLNEYKAVDKEWNPLRDFIQKGGYGRPGSRYGDVAVNELKKAQIKTKQFISMKDDFQSLSNFLKSGEEPFCLVKYTPEGVHYQIYTPSDGELEIIDCVNLVYGLSECIDLINKNIKKLKGRDADS